MQTDADLRRIFRKHFVRRAAGRYKLKGLTGRDVRDLEALARVGTRDAIRLRRHEKYPGRVLYALRYRDRWIAAVYDEEYHALVTALPATRLGTYRKLLGLPAVETSTAPTPAVGVVTGFIPWVALAAEVREKATREARAQAEQRKGAAPAPSGSDRAPGPPVAPRAGGGDPLPPEPSDPADDAPVEEIDAAIRALALRRLAVQAQFPTASSAARIDLQGELDRMTARARGLKQRKHRTLQQCGFRARGVGDPDNPDHLLANLNQAFRALAFRLDWVINEDERAIQCAVEYYLQTKRTRDA
jgi:hypothetical protein